MSRPTVEVQPVVADELAGLRIADDVAVLTRSDRRQIDVGQLADLDAARSCARSGSRGASR